MANAKEYSLKSIETQLLNVFQQQQSVLLSNILSFIAIERLAYEVTANTRFELAPDYTKVTVSEVEPETPAEDTPTVVTEPPKDKK